MDDPVRGRLMQTSVSFLGVGTIGPKEADPAEELVSPEDMEADGTAEGEDMLIIDAPAAEPEADGS